MMSLSLLKCSHLARVNHSHVTQIHSNLNYSILASCANIKHPESINNLTGSRKLYLAQKQPLIYNVNKRHLSDSVSGLASYFTTESWPIACGVKVLEYTHDFTGLPWWASILVTTWALKSVVAVPMSIYCLKANARLENMQPQLLELSDALKKDFKTLIQFDKLAPDQARRGYNKMMDEIKSNMYVQNKCHPYVAYATPLSTLPLWLTLSFSIRNLTGIVPFTGNWRVVDASLALRPDLAAEGCLWFPNLLVPDPTFIIPLAVGITYLAGIELGQLMSKQKPSKAAKRWGYVFRCIGVMGGFIASLMPSCIGFYWFVSALYSLLLSFALNFPRVRRLVRIPKTPNEYEKPMQVLWNNAKEKYSFYRFQKKKTWTDKKEWSSKSDNKKGS